MDEARSLYEREIERWADILAQLEEGHTLTQFRAGPWLVVVPGTSLSPDGYPLSLLLLPDPEGDMEAISRGISTTVLRSVPLADIAARTAADSDAIGARFTLGTFAHRYPGRRDDVYYTLLAATYSAMTAAGDRKPMLSLASVLEASLDSVRGQVREATRRGLLTRSPGRAGGNLTGKAQEILDRLTDEGRNMLEGDDQ